MISSTVIPQKLEGQIYPINGEDGGKGGLQDHKDGMLGRQSKERALIEFDPGEGGCEFIRNLVR